MKPAPSLTVLLGSCLVNTADEHEALWQSKRVSSYTYRLQRGARLGGTEDRKAVIYEVRNGMLHSARYADGGEVKVLGQDRGVGTVEALFRSIDRARAAKFNVSVQYHCVYSFPTIITATMPGAHDAGYTYMVTDFRPLR